MMIVSEMFFLQFSMHADDFVDHSKAVFQNKSTYLDDGNKIHNCLTTV